VSAPVTPPPPAAGPAPVPPPKDAAKQAELHHQRGRRLTQQERWDEALKELDEAIRLNPNLAQASNARGYVYLRLRSWQKAIADFDAAIHVNPAYSNAYHNRAAAKKAAGDQAGSAADEAKAKSLDSPQVR
jgi:tetratricopeptide (TPR) repeat protein